MKLLKEFFLLLFLVTFFAKDQILFFSCYKKRTFQCFFSSHDTKLQLLCFNEFFFETPKKQKKKYVKRCLERKNKTRQVTTMDKSRQVSTCFDKLRHVGNDTVQCSSVLVLEVVFDGLGQV